MELTGEPVGVQTNNVRSSENSNPNVITESLNVSKSPSLMKNQRSGSKDPCFDPTPVASPSQQQQLIRPRKFVVARRKVKREKTIPLTTAPFESKCSNHGGFAYESLDASHDFFSKNPSESDDEESGHEESKVSCESEVRSEEGKEKEAGDSSPIVDLGKGHWDEHNVSDEMGVSTMKRTRDMLLEEARENVPEAGSGRVKHLVEVFEKLSIRKSNDIEEVKEDTNQKGLKWALPGLGLPTPNFTGTPLSSSSFCPSDCFLTSESLGLTPRMSSSSLGSQGSLWSRTSSWGRKTTRKSDESSLTLARRQYKRGKFKAATSQNPFNLITEERGKYKKEEFFKKVKEIMEEEEKLRIPIARGLPWTTDEPERLIKPPIKESTRPINLVLHSDVRAVERAEFDHQVAEKWNLIEQYKMERERLRKLAEEEEIKRLRKDLVPKAQPMPYFDRPFIPRRSEKLPTIPREPRFYIHQHKKIKSCMSWKFENP